MADDIGFLLSKQELATFPSLYAKLEVDGKGNISSAIAVPFLLKSNLPLSTLRDIWNLADVEAKGFLSQNAFYKVLKLVALCQCGKPVSLAYLNQPTPLPVFEGTSVDAILPLKPVVSHSTGNSFSSGRVSTHTTGNRTPTLTNIASPEEKERFKAAFTSCNPQNGSVAGEKAKELFMKSGLAVEILGQIWRLVDPTNSGSLTQEQFMIAMYFIMKMKSGALSSVPPSIPPQLRFSLSPDGIAHSKSFSISSAYSKPAMSLLDEEPSSSPFSSAANINIPATLKLQYDGYFDKLDVLKQGYVTGSQASEFLMKSNLPGPELAKIWDIADTNKSGNLTKDQFAHAMYLIKLQLDDPKADVKVDSQTTISNVQADLLDLSFSSPIPSKTPLPTIQPSPFSPVAPPLSFHKKESSFSTNSSDTGEAELHYQKNILKDMENRFQSLTPLTNEQKKKRDEVDKELKEVMETKRQLTAKLTHAQANYEAESQILTDTQSIIQREKVRIESSRQELKEYEQALTNMLDEKVKIEEFIANAQSEVDANNKRIEEYNEQSSKLKSELEKLKNEMTTVAKVLQVNQQNLVAARNEYTGLKNDLNAGQERLEFDKNRTTQITNQIAVQNAITEKERQKSNSIISNAKPPNSPSSLASNSLNKPTANLSSAKNNSVNSPDSLRTSTTPTSIIDKNDFDVLFENNKPRSQSASPSRQLDSSLKHDHTINKAGSVKSLNLDNLTPVTFTSSSESEPFKSSSRAATGKPPLSPEKKVDSTKPTASSQSSNTTSSTTTSKLTASPTATSSSIQPSMNFTTTSKPTTPLPARSPSPIKPFDDSVFKTGPELSFTNDPFKFPATSSSTMMSFDSMNSSFLSGKTAKKTDVDLDAVFGGVSSTGKTSNTFDGGFNGFYDMKGKLPVPASSTTVFDAGLAVGSSSASAVDEKKAAIDALVGMGFSESNSKDALEKYDYHAEKATNYLLNNQ